MVKARKSISVIAVLIVILITSLVTYLSLVASGDIEVVRPEVVIQIEDVVKEYDGAITEPNFHIESGEDRLEGGSYVKIDYMNLGSDVNSSKEISGTARIYDDGGNDISNKYEITVLNARQLITPRAIEVAVDAASKEYDGKPLVASDYTIVSENKLVAGHKLIPSFVNEAVNVNDEIKAKMTAEIIDVNGNDVSSNYAITYNEDYGDLIINKRPFLLMGISASKEYDGEPLKGYKSSGLLPGDRISDIELPTITEAGSIENNLDKARFRITNSLGADVTNNYMAVVQNLGSLTITPKEINIELNDAEFIYSAQDYSSEIINNEIIDEKISLEDKEFLKSLNLELNITGIEETLFNAGTYKIKPEILVKNKINDFNTKSVVVNVNTVVVKINKKDLTLTACNLSEKYNGEIHNIDNTNFTQDGLEGNDEITLEYLENEFINVGKYANVINLEKVLIENDNNDNVLNNYNIKLIDGVINIEPLNITIKGNGLANIIYDGLNHVCEDETLNNLSEGRVSGELLNNHSVEIKYDNSIEAINAGNHRSAIQNVRILDGEVDVTANYDITTLPGTITINKRSLRITSQPISAMYSGESLVEIPEGVLTSNSLLEGHKIRVYGKAKTFTEFNVMKYRIYLDNIAIYEKNKDVTANYDFEESEITGSCELIKRPVVIASPEFTDITYDTLDIMNKNLEDYKYGSAVGLVDGDKLTVNYSLVDSNTINRAGININHGKNIVYPINYKICNNRNEDVSKYYDFIFDTKKININQKKINLLANGINKEYDGISYSVNSNELLSIKDKEYLNRNGLNLNDIQREFKNVCNENIEFTILKGLSNQDNVIISNPIYNVTITKKPISIKSVDLNKIYSGANVTVSSSFEKPNYEIVSGGLATGDEINISFNNLTERKNAGSYKNEFDISIISRGFDVSSNYDIAKIFGNIIIKKLPVTIKGNDLNITYDGQNHICEDEVLKSSVEGRGSGLINNHQANITYDKSVEAINAGNHRSAIQNVRILDGEVDVTANYDITTLPGIITINRRPLNITLNENINTIYDGTTFREMLPDQYKVEGLMNDVSNGIIHQVYLNDLFVTLDAPIGEKVNYTFDKNKILIDSDGINVKDNYIITVTDGTYNIGKMELHINPIENQNLEYNTINFYNQYLTKFNNQFEITKGYLAGNDLLTLVYTVEETIDNKAGFTGNIKLDYSVNNDHNECYNVIFDNKPTLTISKKNLNGTLKYDKEYPTYTGMAITFNFDLNKVLSPEDNEYLKNIGYAITGGNKLEYVNAGKYPTSILNLAITNNNNAQYNVELNVTYSDVVIKKKKIEKIDYELVNSTFVFDGKAHSAKLKNNKLEGISSYELNQGIYAGKYSVIDLNSIEIDPNYDVSKENVVNKEFEITPYEIKLTESYEKVIDFKGDTIDYGNSLLEFNPNPELFKEYKFSYHPSTKITFFDVLNKSKISNLSLTVLDNNKDISDSFVVVYPEAVKVSLAYKEINDIELIGFSNSIDWYEEIIVSRENNPDLFNYDIFNNNPDNCLKRENIRVNYKIGENAVGDLTTAGSYDITLSGEAYWHGKKLGFVKVLSSNYVLTINKKNITIVAPSLNVVYGSEIIFDDESWIPEGIVYTPIFTIEENVGEYPIVSNLSELINENSNYNINFINGILTIRPEKINISIGSMTIPYGENIDFNDYITVNKELGAASTYKEIPSFIDASMQEVGKYNIITNVDGLKINPNYDVVVNNGILTVRPEKINISIGSMTIPYGENIDFNDYLTVNKELGYESKYQENPSFIDASMQAVGKYNIITNVDGLKINPNYDVVVNNGILTVRPEKITIVVPSVTTEYGTQYIEPEISIIKENTTSNYNFTPQFIDDTYLTCGTYTLVENVSEAYLDNYDVTFINGTLTIEKKKIIIQLSPMQEVTEPGIYKAQNIIEEGLIEINPIVYYKPGTYKAYDFVVDPNYDVTIIGNEITFI